MNEYAEGTYEEMDGNFIDVTMQLISKHSWACLQHKTGEEMNESAEQYVMIEGKNDVIIST